MRKTVEQKNIIRRRCRVPFFWTIQDDNDFYLVIRNQITGTIRVIDK